jgi:hypothetical protein
MVSKAADQPTTAALFGSKHSPSSLPPIAVFGDPMHGSAGNFTTTRDVTNVLAAALELDGFAARATRLHAAASLSRVAAAQVQVLRTQLPASGDEPEARSAVQTYFRIRTAAELGADELLLNSLQVVADAANDLVDAPVSGSDIRRIGLAIASVVGRYRGSDQGEAPELVVEEANETLSLEEIWFRRWIIGHQLHAMFNVHAAFELVDASHALANGDTGAATRAIECAATLVEGFPGARAQALAVPASFYQDVLRPTMLPPMTSVPLSGRMHLEYNGYRQRFAELLHQLPMSTQELASSQPALAFARERIIEADLIESERHVTSVEPLVGDSRSLIQTTKSYDNAVSALRRIRHRRAAVAAPLVRFPDVPIGTARPATAVEPASPG